VARRHRASAADGESALDLLVIGSGPAGLAAGLTAIDRGLAMRVLEQEESLGGSLLHYPRRKMVLTQPVALPPWGALDREEYRKEALLETFTQMIAQAGLEIDFGRRVDSLTPADGGWRVAAGGEELQARNVLLALGRRGTPRKLGVPGEELPKVAYRLIDAEAYRGQRILVVGGGDSAVEAAIGLASEGRNEVTLSYRREKLVRIKRKNQERMDAMLAAGEIRGAFSTQVTRIESAGVTLRRSDGEDLEVANDYVFVFAGGVPPFGLLKKAGIRFGGEGESESAAA